MPSNQFVQRDNTLSSTTNQQPQHGNPSHEDENNARSSQDRRFMRTLQELLYPMTGFSHEVTGHLQYLSWFFLNLIFYASNIVICPAGIYNGCRLFLWAFDLYHWDVKLFVLCCLLITTFFFAERTSCLALKHLDLPRLMSGGLMANSNEDQSTLVIYFRRVMGRSPFVFFVLGVACGGVWIYKEISALQTQDPEVSGSFHWLFGLLAIAPLVGLGHISERFIEDNATETGSPA